jgi:hypothetical protein
MVTAEIRQVESSLNLDLNLPHALKPVVAQRRGIVPTHFDEKRSA